MFLRRADWFLSLLKPSIAADADGGHEAAGRAMFLAIAEEKIATASGTQITDDDVLVAQARVEELGMIGFAQVEQNVLWRRLMPGQGHVEPLQGIRFVPGAEFVEPVRSVRELRAEFRSYLRAHFVAASADCGTDSSKHVRGIATELHLHLANGFGYDAPQGAAPACMNRRDRAFSEIDQENRNAVGGLNGKE